MAHILVIGASRGIGEAVCHAAIAGGHKVRAMSRRGKLRGGLQDKCDTVAGDARVGEAVRGALQGIDVVVLSLGVPVSLDLLTKPVCLFSEATRIVLHEMEQAAVSKLVCVTGFGAGDSYGSVNPLQRIPFNFALKRAYDDKSIQEELIENARFSESPVQELDWLIVRPGVLTSGSASGRYRVLTHKNEWRNGIISRADVADFIVKRIEAGAFGREKPVLIRCPL